MSVDWVEDALERMENKSIITSTLKMNVQQNTSIGNTHKETVAVKNQQRTGKTLTDSPNEPPLEFDQVDVVKTGRVVGK